MTTALTTLERLDLKSATIEDLRSELARSVRLTARELQWMAQVWHELQVRGEDMSALRSGLLAYLPGIAAGRVEAEIVVKFAGQPLLLNRLAALSVSQQRVLVETGAIEVARRQSSGRILGQTVSIGSLAAREILLVFTHEGHQRTIAEQAAILEREEERKGPAQHRLRFDETGEYILGGGNRISVRDIFDLLGRYYNVDVAEVLADAHAAKWEPGKDE